MKKLIVLALLASVPAVCQSIIAGKDSTNTTRVVKTDSSGQVFIANPGGGGTQNVQGVQATGEPVTANPVYVAGQNNLGNLQPIPTSQSALATLILQAGSDNVSNSGGIGSMATIGAGLLFANTAPHVFNGVSWDRPFVCPSSAVVNVTNGTTAQLVALTAAQTIRVCSIVLTSTAATTATLSYGTGTTCGTGNAALTGAMALGASTAPLTISLGADGALRTASGNALCLAAGATSVTGFITYAKY